MTSIWKCREVKASAPVEAVVPSPTGGTARKPAAATIVRYDRVGYAKHRETLIVYPGKNGWVAYYSGNSGENVGKKLGDDLCEELYSKPIAVMAMLGSIESLPLVDLNLS